MPATVKPIRTHQARVDFLSGIQRSFKPCINPSLTSFQGAVAGEQMDILKERLAWASILGIRTIHVDIFDRNYVGTDNMEVFTPGFVNELYEWTLKNDPNMLLDVHLMVRPSTKGGPDGFLRYITQHVQAGADFISVHWGAFLQDETTGSAAVKNDRTNALVRRTLKYIAVIEACPGLVMKHTEDPLIIKGYDDNADFGLLMSVEPGAGSRPFEQAAIANMAILARSGFSGALADDGAISNKTIAELFRIGARWFVVGSYLFGKGDKLLSEDEVEQAYKSLFTATQATP